MRISWLDLKKLVNPPSWIFEVDQRWSSEDTFIRDWFLFHNLKIGLSGWYLEDALAHPNDLHCFGSGSLGRRLCYLACTCDYEMSHATNACLKLSSFCQQLTRMIQYNPICIYIYIQYTYLYISSIAECLVLSVYKWSNYIRTPGKSAWNLTNDRLGISVFQGGASIFSFFSCQLGLRTFLKWNCPKIFP